MSGSQYSNMQAYGSIQEVPAANPHLPLASSANAASSHHGLSISEDQPQSARLFKSARAPAIAQIVFAGLSTLVAIVSVAIFPYFRGWPALALVATILLLLGFVCAMIVTGMVTCCAATGNFRTAFIVQCVSLALYAASALFYLILLALYLKEGGVFRSCDSCGIVVGMSIIYMVLECLITAVLIPSIILVRRLHTLSNAMVNYPITYA